MIYMNHRDNICQKEITHADNEQKVTRSHATKALNWLGEHEKNPGNWRWGYPAVETAPSCSWPPGSNCDVSWRTTPWISYARDI
ncbi:hypothetical protein J6590_080037 [Homalodisca vitripennis]|nr:hypothetical protein J6590_080037 [Homalodisca vitripennis]